MRDSLPPGVARTLTPGQGTMAAPWYRLPPSQSLHHRIAADRPSRWLLGVMGACAGLGVVLVLSDPAATRTSSQARWEAPPERAAAALPVSHAAELAREARERREAREAHFAAIDEALGAAAAGSRLASLEAHDRALRAFAAQQATRYDELRATLRAIAGPAGMPAPAAEDHGALGAAVGASGGDASGDTAHETADGGFGAIHVERLTALREAEGPGFDLLYVRQALALNRALLAELDAVLATIEDAELRDAVEQVRGTIDATMPASDPGGRESVGRDSVR